MPSEPPNSDSPSLDPILDEALAWFASLRADDVTEVDHARFQAWRNEKSAHAEAYAQIVAFWDSTEFTLAAHRFAEPTIRQGSQPKRKQRATGHARIAGPGRTGAIMPTGVGVEPTDTVASGQAFSLPVGERARVQDEDSSAKHRKHRRHDAGLSRSSRRIAGIAAVLLLAVALFQAGDLRVALQADYQTATGVQQTIALADGSRVTLNTGSAIAVDVGRTQRKVRVLKGESYFDVAEQRTVSFEVDAGGTIVQVLGTQFAVRQEDDRTTVTVRKGQVLVSAQTESAETVTLTAGEQIDLTLDGFGTVHKIDRDVVFVWLNGRMIFKDRPLDEVLAEVDRYHHGRFYIADERLRATRVSGNYKLDDPLSIATSLASVAAADIMTLTDFVTILR